MDDVFVGSAALADGTLSRGQLRWNYRALFPDVYMLKGVTPSLSVRTAGAWLWSGRRAVIAGLAAAAWHGGVVADDVPVVEMIWHRRRPPPGIVVRNERISPDEIVEVAGLPVTTPERTAFDLARHTSRDVAVTQLDALARATGLTAARVEPLADRYRGARNLCQTWEAITLMDGGSRSPGETAVRLALMDAGFPAPKTDFTVTSTGGNAVIAMGFSAPKVGVDFGPHSPDLLTRLGWAMIPTAGTQPQVVVYRVRTAVVERGYPVYRLRMMSRP